MKTDKQLGRQSGRGVGTYWTYDLWMSDSVRGQRRKNLSYLVIHEKGTPQKKQIMQTFLVNYFIIYGENRSHKTLSYFMDGG